MEIASLKDAIMLNLIVPAACMLVEVGGKALFWQVERSRRASR